MSVSMWALYFGILNRRFGQAITRLAHQRSKLGSVPSKRQQKLHGPAVLSEITIKKAKSQEVLIDVSSPPSRRHDFDPRSVAHGATKTINDFDFEHLASITEGNCGIVKLLRARNLSNEPCLHYYSNEEVVATGQHVDLPKTFCEIAFDSRRATDPEGSFISMISLSCQQVAIVEEITREQSDSDYWFKYRQGRNHCFLLQRCCHESE